MYKTKFYDIISMDSLINAWYKYFFIFSPWLITLSFPCEDILLPGLGITLPADTPGKIPTPALYSPVFTFAAEPKFTKHKNNF